MTAANEKFFFAKVTEAVNAIGEVFNENAGGLHALAESGLGEIVLTIYYSKDFAQLDNIDKIVKEANIERVRFNLSDFVSLAEDHPGPTKAVTSAVIDTLHKIGPAYILSSDAELDKLPEPFTFDADEIDD